VSERDWIIMRFLITGFQIQDFKKNRYKFYEELPNTLATNPRGNWEANMVRNQGAA